MVQRDFDDQLRRQLRTLQRVVGGPTDAMLARHSGVAAATFSEVMSGKRRPRPAFVTKVVSGCLACARQRGHAPLDEQRVLQALRLPGYTAADAGILERDEDLGRCSAVLDRVRTRAGATVVVEGAAGIGKSELLARVSAEAAVRGIVPLAVRGNQRHRTMAFGGARALLARWVAGHGADDRAALFAGPAAIARTPLGIQHTHHGGPPTMIGLTEGLYWLLVHATSRPDADELLLAVDDAHWLDEETLHWLDFLADRLAGLPVVLLLAHRPNDPRPTPVLTRIALRATEVVRPRELSPDAVRTMVRRGLAGPAEPDDGFCAAFVERSGGNPFYLRWMLNLARERRLAPTADAAAEVAALTPRHVVAYLNDRLTALGPPARNLAQAVAVLGPGCSLDRAARLAALTTAEAKHEYDLLRKAVILAPGPTMDFCHPIIRSAVYEDIDPSLRSDTHRAAARLLHARHADADTVAAHLLEVRATGNRWVVDRLCAAAATAMASGLSGTAARYLRRAVQEPPPPAQRCRVRLGLGQALALGEVTAAIPELRAAHDQAPDPTWRTDTAIALARAYGYADRLGDAVRLLDTVIAATTDDRLRDRLLLEQLTWAAWWADDPHRIDRMHHLDRVAPALPGHDHRERMLRTVHAWSLVLRGEPRAAALAAMRPVMDHGVVFSDVELGMEPATMAGFVHLYTGELDTAHDLFARAVDDFHRDGWRGTHLGFTHAHLGNIALRQGRLADAVAEADIALRFADRAGENTPAGWFATGTLIEALIARGEIDQAATVCARRGYDRHHPDAVVLPVPRAVVGATQLARGDTATAVATLRGIGDWLDATHLTNPTWCPWRFDLARALRHTAPQEADELAVTARRQADRFGAPTARGLALCTLAALRPTAAVELLEEATRILDTAPDRHAHARSLADLGAALIRAGHPTAAVRPLHQALTLADRCDAPALRAAIARHLTRTGNAPPHPPRANVLHPRQRRVAQLAAQGLSEAETAHAMLLPRHTVAALLRDACDRLRTPSRATLTRALTHPR